MKEGLLSYLCCPGCRHELRIAETVRHGDEIVSGALRCTACSRSFPVQDGIPVMLEGKALRDFSKTKKNWENWWRHVRQKADIDLYDTLWVEAEKNLGAEPLYRKEDFKGKVVVDAGCGNGRYLAEFARYGAREIIAIDLGRQVFEAKALNSKLKNIHYVQGDLTNPPFKNNSVDVVASHGVLHHTPHPQETFSRLAACVKKGGMVAIYVYHKEWAYFKTHRKNLLLDAVYATGVLIWQTIRKITSRLPHPLLLCCCYCIAAKSSVEYWLQHHRWTKSIGKLLQLVPPFAYIGVNFHERLVRNYDHYSATFNYFFGVDEVVEWFRANGFDDLDIVSIPVSIRGRKRGSGETKGAMNIHQYPLVEHFRFRDEWERLYAASKKKSKNRNGETEGDGR